MQNTDKRPMKKQLKRTMWFIAGYAVLALILSAIMIVYDIPQWLNMLVIVVLAGVMYLLFLWICAIIDKKKKDRQAGEEKDDPFAE